jgi:hypothetical protein
MKNVIETHVKNYVYVNMYDHYEMEHITCNAYLNGDNIGKAEASIEKTFISPVSGDTLSIDINLDGTYSAYWDDNDYVSDAIDPIEVDIIKEIAHKDLLTFKDLNTYYDEICKIHTCKDINELSPKDVLKTLLEIKILNHLYISPLAYVKRIKNK